MILMLKFAAPRFGHVTVRTDFFMVTKEGKNYKVGYKTSAGYRFEYDVETFEVLFNG